MEMSAPSLCPLQMSCQGQAPALKACAYCTSVVCFSIFLFNRSFFSFPMTVISFFKSPSNTMATGQHELQDYDGRMFFVSEQFASVRGHLFPVDPSTV